MKKGLNEIICIIDRSGSMSIIKDDVIGGFDNFMEEQKKLPGEARVTYIQFDHEYEKVFENKSINEVTSIKDSYIPRGWTALLDAVGETIARMGERIDKTPEDEKPEQVIVVIFTDGYENASREYNKSQIKGMIEHQQNKYSWQFIFLGANQDSFAEAGSMGINANNIANFKSTKQGVKDGYAITNTYTSRYRTSA